MSQVNEGQGMTYLITGGAGFIGSHVAEALLQRGETVVVIDNFNDYYDPAIKRGNAARLRAYERLKLVEGDIRDPALLERLFAEERITHVAHLAAMPGVRASVAQARLYMDVNLTGTMNLLEACKTNGVKQFVLASTSSVYGKTEILPFIESDTADRPLAAYPASKRAAELLAHTYHNLGDMHVTVLRFFNVYGPAGRPDMMPWKLMDATQSGEVIKLFNNGDIHRDWTYISDTVAGVLAALDKPLGYEVINLGCGAPISLSDFVEIIEEYAGRTINKLSVPTPLSDPPITYCDNSKARELLGFTPTVSTRDGLWRTWQWYREFRGI
ncbi:MAG: SDR family NAD(P)-dependent oxidoreductase [Chloroflexi bacterium]|nr:SDR family NAD(P)-dependent oxidoreductase [Chloroflexota bacterium]